MTKKVFDRRDFLKTVLAGIPLGKSQAIRNALAEFIADHGGTVQLSSKPEYSPAGKNTLSIMTLQGYEPWMKYEADYFAVQKDAYRAEKNRRATS